MGTICIKAKNEKDTAEKRNQIMAKPHDQDVFSSLRNNGLRSSEHDRLQRQRLMSRQSSLGKKLGSQPETPYRNSNSGEVVFIRRSQVSKQSNGHEKKVFSTNSPTFPGLALLKKQGVEIQEEVPYYPEGCAWRRTVNGDLQLELPKKKVEMKEQGIQTEDALMIQLFIEKKEEFERLSKIYLENPTQSPKKLIH